MASSGRPLSAPSRTAPHLGPRRRVSTTIWAQ
jgi:hypothetical protein